MGKLNARVAAEVVSGIARGCRANGCALIGGETAEMPGLYADGEYDLAGFIIGVVERKSMITGKIDPSRATCCWGCPPPACTPTAIRWRAMLLFEVAGHHAGTQVAELGGSIAEELLKIHRSYLTPLRALHDAGLLKGAAHITGGGITDNTPRILPKGLGRAHQSRLLAGAAGVRAAAQNRPHPGTRLAPHVQSRDRHDLRHFAAPVERCGADPRIPARALYQIGEVIRGRGRRV